MRAQRSQPSAEVQLNCGGAASAVEAAGVRPDCTVSAQCVAAAAEHRVDRLAQTDLTVPPGRTGLLFLCRRRGFLRQVGPN